MPALTEYLSRRGEILVLGLVGALSVGLMMLSSGAKDATLRALNDAAMTPVQSTLSGVTDLAGTRAENDSLRTRLAEATVEMADLRERNAAVDRLERMLGFRDRSRFHLAGARVVARDAGRIGSELKIDRGALEGVRKNLAVITPDGLVGKVSSVEPRSAYVRPITGRQCRVSARVLPSRTEGILDWSPGQGLHLTFLPFRAEVSEGDAVVTSGLGGVFPPGIPIGTVSRVATDPEEGSQRVTVEPAIGFSRLEELFVVTAQRWEEDRSEDGEGADGDRPGGGDADAEAGRAGEPAPDSGA